MEDEFCSICGHVCGGKYCESVSAQGPINWGLVAEAFKELEQKKHLKFDHKKFATELWSVHNKSKKQYIKHN